VKRLTRSALIVLVTVGLSIPVALECRSRSLQQLGECYRAVPTEGRKYFESPCASKRLGLLALVGISRTEIESTLGPADWCSDAVSVSGKVLVRPKCLQPAWSFFYLPTGSLGGGPNLVCWSRDGESCILLSWLLTA
jgi:hypothetical protein